MGCQMSRRCLLITFPPGFQLRAVPGWRPLPDATLSPLASPHSEGSCHFQSPGQNYKLPLVKIDTSLTGCRLVLIPNSLNHRRPGLTLKWASGSTQFPGHPWVLLTYLAQLTKRTGRGGGNGNHCAFSLRSTFFSQENPDSQTIQCVFKLSWEGGSPFNRMK